MEENRRRVEAMPKWKIGERFPVKGKQMTNTELIATKLFGWTPCEPPDDCNSRLSWYSRPGFSRDDVDLAGVSNGVRLGGTVDPDEGWPDFDDYIFKWYHVRRMEDALAEKRLLPEYKWALVSLVQSLAESQLLPEPTIMLRATAEQRVAAAVRVLDAGI